MAPHETDPLERFTRRVDDYVRFRPGYPPVVVDALRRLAGLDPTWTVADIGSGTGIFTRLLLENGNRVVAVEPNAAMREAAEAWLAANERFASVDGRAEDTTLAGASVDLVVAAQAFHWFDAAAARAECRRILRPPGWAALVWNTRETLASPFMRAYEELLVGRAVDYTGVDHRNARSRIAAFFDGYAMERIIHTDHLDLEAALGRMLSASYVPAPDHPGHTAIVEGLREIVDRYGRGGRVEWVYATEVFVGAIGC